MSGPSDYPVDNPSNIAGPIYRAMILQSMAMEYFKAMRGSPEEFTLSDGFEAAHATWDTDWDDDPAPRTIEAGIEAVRQDLQYWNED